MRSRKRICCGVSFCAVMCCWGDGWNLEALLLLVSLSEVFKALRKLSSAWLVDGVPPMFWAVDKSAEEGELDELGEVGCSVCSIVSLLGDWLRTGEVKLGEAIIGRRSRMINQALKILQYRSKELTDGNLGYPPNNPFSEHNSSFPMRSSLIRIHRI